MQVKLETGSVSQVGSDALVIIGFEGTPPEGPAAVQIKEFYDSTEFSGKSGTAQLMSYAAGSKMVNHTTGETWVLKPLGEVGPIIAAGGLFPYAQKVGMLK